jgi:hypothetical protein
MLAVLRRDADTGVADGPGTLHPPPLKARGLGCDASAFVVRGRFGRERGVVQTVKTSCFA